MFPTLHRLVFVTGYITNSSLLKQLSAVYQKEFTNNKFHAPSGVCLHKRVFFKSYLRSNIEPDSEVQRDSVEEDLSQHHTPIPSYFPTAETHTSLFHGLLYTDIPIVHIKTSKNNTICALTDPKGTCLDKRSAGTEGFFNAKKGTNIAAQAVGVTLGKRTLKKKIDTVRVCVRGIGAGRLPAIKGLQMTGLNIVSITDTTPVLSEKRRSRKQRRL